MLKNNESKNRDNMDKYKLETDIGIVKRSLTNTVVGAVSIAFSVLVRIYCHSSAVDSAFLNVISVLLALTAIGFFTAEIFVRAKRSREERLAVDEANREYFEDADVIPVFSTERMFNADAEKDISTNGESDSPRDYFISPDDEFGFSDATKEFELFAKERGCVLDANTVKRLFASLASSRIMVVRSLPDEEFESFVRVICEYFGTNAYIDRVGESYNGVQGEFIQSAQAERSRLHFIALTDVIASSIPDHLSSFVNYAKAPESSNFILSKIEGATEKYYLPSNLWLILNLADGERVVSLPGALLEVSSVLDVSVTVCEKTESTTKVRTIYCDQLRLMTDKAKCNVDETEWKKLDAFTEFLGGYVPFAISNKQWVGMEKYTAVFSECTGVCEGALDEAISVRVVPSVLKSISGSDKKTDIIAGLNNAFGEGRMPACSRTIKELRKGK